MKDITAKINESINESIDNVPSKVRAFIARSLEEGKAQPEGVREMCYVSMENIFDVLDYDDLKAKPEDFAKWLCTCIGKQLIKPKYWTNDEAKKDTKLKGIHEIEVDGFDDFDTNAK